MVPYLAAARALPVAEIPRDVVETFAVSLGLFPLLSTAAVVLVFLSLGLLGFRPREALLASLAVAFASLFWHYARMGQEENLLALTYAAWLYGAARLAAGRAWPATWMAAGASAALATRWASVPVLAILFVATLALGWHHRGRIRGADVAAGCALTVATIAALLTYNYVRFGNWLETGYGLLFAHHEKSAFVLEGYTEHLAALLVSPYRGLLIYSPIIVAAVAGTWLIPRGAPKILAWTALAVFAVSLLFFAAYHFWAGGHSWGPRFLASPHVLLAPALAALFLRRTRLAWLMPALAALQIVSTMLPASTEEYVWFNLNREKPGHCSPWIIECTAVQQRVPRALAAVANTAANRPGTVLSGRPMVAPELVLETSDYRTLYWWPVRIAFRLGLMPPWVALLLSLAGLSAAAAFLRRAWAATREP
jgi:hypothetical protein